MARGGGLALAAAALVLLTACASRKPPPSPSPPVPSQPAPPLPSEILARVDARRLRADVVELAVRIGPRPSGSQAEQRALKTVARRCEEMGLAVAWQLDIALLPVSGSTANLVVTLPGGVGSRIELGAHVDSKRCAGGCPGANDNASGVAVLLECARLLRELPPPAPVSIVFFGGEEMVDSVFDHHHYGSRARLRELGPTGPQQIQAMLSVDMVGCGQPTLLETMTARRAERELCRALVQAGEAIGWPVKLGPVGRAHSDHEAYARAGFPAVWVHTPEDAAYHTPEDRAERVRDDNLVAHTRLVLRYLYGLSVGYNRGAAPVAEAPGGQPR